MGEEFKQSSCLTLVTEYEEMAVQLIKQEFEKEQTSWKKTVRWRKTKDSYHEAISSVWMYLFAH